MGIIEWLDSALQDARYGLRQLRKTPALGSAVVLSLAIGVGANSGVFSLVDAAILRPLPVKDPEALRIVEWTSKGLPGGGHNINGDVETLSRDRFQGSSVGANLYRRLAHEQTAFEMLIGISDVNPVAVAVDASPSEQVLIQYVSANFFQGLGTMPVIGRPFRDEEDRLGYEPAVVVSHRFWMRRLEGRSNIQDRNIRVNNVPARIVGVAPAGFFGLKAGEWTDIYAPLAMRAAFLPSGGDGAARGEDDNEWWVRQVARLKPGTPEAAARAQVAGLFRNLAVPEAANIEPARIPDLVTLPGRRGFQALNPTESQALWVLMLLVGIVLLIVCANVANLLLSRSVGRQREWAVRLALGAPRSWLVRQQLIESGLLALVGSAAGLALGYPLARSIHLLFQTGEFALQLDARILGYTGTVAVMTALLFGVAPAVRAARSNLGDALKVQTRSIIGGRLRLPRLLVSIQIALCLTALLAAGLLGRTLENLNLVDIGFDRQNLAYASMNPWQTGYSAERVGAYADRVSEKLAEIPGVLRVSPIRIRPLQGGGSSSRVNIAGRPFQTEANRVNRNRVGRGLFETLGIPVIAGRAIEQRDLRPNAEAVVVDELFVRKFFPNEDPLGRRFGLGANETNRYEIVGVVRDSRYNNLHADPVPTVYHPYLPGEMKDNPIHFAIRTTMDSVRLAEAVRRAVAAIDPAVPLSQFHTQTGLIDRMLRTERLLGFVSVAFGLVASTLAAVGLGGLLAYTVARRTNEIGVRMALGASPGDVVRGVLRDSLGMVCAGIVIGLPSAYAVALLLRTTLFGLGPMDPWTTMLSFVLLLAVALIAAWVPARRAARIDPMTALREE